MSKYEEKPIIKCPYCHIFAQMDSHLYSFPQDLETNPLGQVSKCKLDVRRCSHCGGKFFYINGKLKYPEPETMVPEKDMPDDVKSLFVEAASICNRSPRAACALLRLAIERLCNVLKAEGKTIDEKIADLTRKGLSSDIQKALDIVRVVGNKAVHPGQICFDVDDLATASMLFNLINIIVRRILVEPNTINSIYKQLPETVKDKVVKRDGK